MPGMKPKTIAKVGVSRNDAIDEGAVPKHLPKPDLVPLSYDPLIPEELLSIRIHVGESKLDLNMREILYYGRSSLTDQDDREIDKSLDASSEYRVSVGVAYAVLGRHLQDIENEFSMFELEHLNKAMQDLTMEKQAMQGGKITQATLSATKDEKLAKMLSDPMTKSIWETMRNQLADLRRDISILSKVDDILKDRTSFLMGISKRRFTERTNRDPG